MSKRTFKNTYIVLFGDVDNDRLVKFSKFNTVDDFKKHLNKKHLSYDAVNGMFVNENDEDHNSCFCICEKKYYEETGCIADWDHVILEDYLNDRQCDITWSEECESCWFAYGRYDITEDENLEALFNDLKAIDGIEIELELPKHWDLSNLIENFTGDEEYGVYLYGETFNDWVKEFNVNDNKVKQTEIGCIPVDEIVIDSSCDITFVDWDAVDKMLQEQNNKWPVAF